MIVTGYESLLKQHGLADGCQNPDFDSHISTEILIFIVSQPKYQL